MSLSLRAAWLCHAALFFYFLKKIGLKQKSIRPINSYHIKFYSEYTLKVTSLPLRNSFKSTRSAVVIVPSPFVSIGLA